MEQSFNAINVLLNFLNGSDLADRFLRRKFLTPNECQALRDDCQKNFGRAGVGTSGNVIAFKGGKNGYKPATKTVSKGTEYSRLTYIAEYVAWLAKHLLSKSFDSETLTAVDAMKTALLTLRPNKKGRNDDADETKGLSREQEKLLMEVVRPGSEQNPFTRSAIQVRNELIVQTLRCLGIRGGELLNIRVDDIDFKRNEVVIRRRADEKGDPRRRQPLVKTRARRLALDPRLAASFRSYIVQIRRRIPNAAAYPYVFVTHKSGPTQGQPMSIEAYKQMIRRIAGSHPLLARFTGHALRHTWNDRFSEYMDHKVDAESESMQERIREDLMGWSEDSGTAKDYNKRFIRRKGRTVGLELQEAAYEATLAVSTSQKQANYLAKEEHDENSAENR
jgi:integrase